MIMMMIIIITGLHNFDELNCSRKLPGVYKVLITFLLLFKGQMKSRNNVILRKSIYFVVPKFCQICKLCTKSFLCPVIQKLKVLHFVSFDFRLFLIWETGGVAVTSFILTTESRSWSSFSVYSLLFVVVVVVVVVLFCFLVIPYYSWFCYWQK